MRCTALSPTYEQAPYSERELMQCERLEDHSDCTPGFTPRHEATWVKNGRPVLLRWGKV